MGAVALLALSIGYSLPVYHREISGLLHDIGLSSLKISIADVTLEAALASKGSQGVVSVSGGATGSVAQSVVRFTDPTPGLQTLKYDFIGNDKLRKPENLMDRDERYVKFLQGAQTEEYNKVLAGKKNAQIFFAPVSQLARCLDEYRDKIQDSHLLLIDMTKTISPLFLMHKRWGLSP
jgi:hypothetical protein